LSAAESCSCSQAQGDEQESDREMAATHRSIRVTTSHEKV
jgi:hypothetical protein